jgi:hypothetical protein
VFQKEIKLQVPYSDALAQVVEDSQRAQGKAVQASTAEPKERIRLAILAPTASRREENYRGQGVGKAASSVAPVQTVKVAADQEAVRARPVVDLLRREMVKGHSREDVVKALRLAFSVDTLRQTRIHWEPFLREAGLYGVVYATQDSFEDCRTGADMLAKYNPGVRAIVAGKKCESCIYSKASRCLMFGKPLVKDAAEVLTPETVEAVLTEHKTAGRLPTWEKTAGMEPRDALKAIHEMVSKPQSPMTVAGRLDVLRAFHGTTVAPIPSGMARREIVKTAARFMNEGLYGKDLLAALKARFEPRDLVAARADLRHVLAEQGLQGIHYIDPAVYADYGRGCDEAARMHRSRLVPYVKTASKCASCVLQTRPGFCSKLNKPLVMEPPYINKRAQQREILSSGPSTENAPAALLNRVSMLHEYQMQHEMDVEVQAVSAASNVTVAFDATRKVKL